MSFIITSLLQSLEDAGVVPGSDITPEAALAKLSYICGKQDLSIEEKRKLLASNLRGEITENGVARAVV